MIRLRSLWFACLLPWIVGCGASQVTALGVVVQNNQPVAFELTDSVFLSFNLIDAPTARSFSGRVLPDGSFTVAGTDGGGIPPGTYRITLKTAHYGPPPKNADAQKLADRFEGEFADAARSPFVVELTPGKQEIVIDVGARTATVR